MAALVRAHVDVEQKQIQLTFLDCRDEQLYQVTKKIKYVVKNLPGRRDVVHCPTGDSVSTVLKEHGIVMSKWQIYRYIRNGGFSDILKGVQVERF